MQIQTQKLQQIGTGNFSKVYKGNDQYHHQYAVKVMYNNSNIARKEAYILRQLNHPNIIRFKKYSEDHQGYKLFMEYLPTNVLTLYQQQSYGLKQQQVKSIMFQIALGLHYLHSKGIVHRDIKPQNILINKSTAIVKLIDFGLAVPINLIKTDYIATRWYRAPQNLLGTKQYTTAIDIFSLGCVVVQLYLGNPLFPGTENIDQIFRIFNILGYPTQHQWPQGLRRMSCLGMQIRKTKQTTLSLTNLLSPCHSDFIDLVSKMLVLNPMQRITAKQIVTHPYFFDIKTIIPQEVFKRYQNDLIFTKNNKILQSNIVESKPLSFNIALRNPPAMMHQQPQIKAISQTIRKKQQKYLQQNSKVVKNKPNYYVKRSNSGIQGQNPMFIFKLNQVHSANLKYSPNRIEIQQPIKHNTKIFQVKQDNRNYSFDKPQYSLNKQFQTNILPVQMPYSPKSTIIKFTNLTTPKQQKSVFNFLDKSQALDSRSNPWFNKQETAKIMSSNILVKQKPILQNSLNKSSNNHRSNNYSQAFPMNNLQKSKDNLGQFNLGDKIIKKAKKCLFEQHLMQLQKTIHVDDNQTQYKKDKSTHPLNPDIRINRNNYREILPIRQIEETQISVVSLGQNGNHRDNRRNNTSSNLCIQSPKIQNREIRNLKY